MYYFFEIFHLSYIFLADYVENQNGLYSAGVAAFVKVELRCGAYHQEIGYGISEGVPKKGEAISFAREVKYFFSIVT